MMSHEEWRAIPGFEGRYEVSNYGRVRSLRFINRNCNYLLATPRVLKQTPRDGYSTVNLSVNKIHYKRNVHFLVLLAFVGPRPDGREGAHRDGKRTNNHLSNLRWATGTENAKDKEIHGTKGFGTKCYNAKLTDHAVIDIRQLYKRGSRQFGVVGLARTYGVHPGTVWRALHAKAWAHVSTAQEQQS